MGPKAKKQESVGLVTLQKGKIDNLGEVSRNSKGGVQVSRAEIESAFAFLDTEQKGKVTAGNLKKRLASFFPDLTTRDYKYLMDNKKEITIDDLTDILVDNEIKEFDPVAEAFRAYDPENKGFISNEKLSEIFATFGFGELSGEELGLLTKAADVDGDGIVSLGDFRRMMDPSVKDVDILSKASNQEAGDATGDADTGTSSAAAETETKTEE